MKKYLKIETLKERQSSQVVRILSVAFNMKAAKVKREMVRDMAAGKNKLTVFVSSVENKVVGVVECHNLSSTFCGFSHLAVDVSYRKRGIGRALVKHAETFIRKRWMKGRLVTIALVDETKKDNPASFFYERMGYAPEPEPRTEADLPILVKRFKRSSRPTPSASWPALKMRKIRRYR